MRRGFFVSVAEPCDRLEAGATEVESRAVARHEPGCQTSPMSPSRHRDFQIQTLSIGEERQPLVVVDNLFAEPDEVFEMAAGKSFGYVAHHYPGVRAKVPLTVQHYMLGVLRAECAQAFGLAHALNFTSCHFSLVTTPPDQLSYLQRVPHIDSSSGDELALIVYLFKRDQGGTAFYRHRKSGFEYVNEERKAEYYRYLEEEQQSVLSSSARYIGGDTDCYERIARQEGVYNRMLVYRRTTLHSADLGPEIEFSTDPRRARLTLTGFLA